MPATILTAQELAVFLKVTRQTIHKWHQRKMIPSLAPRKPLLFDLDDVLRALKQPK